MKCILIDDEALARLRMRDLISDSGFELDIVGEAEDGRGGLKLIKEVQPEIVFLDIQMPGMDGFDVLERILEPRPWIIFVTAFDEYAIQAFEHFAIDYLTKPVRLERLKKSLSRIESLIDSQKKQENLERVAVFGKEKNALITVRYKHSFKVLDQKEIVFFEANEKLVFAKTSDGKFRVDLTLQELEDRLPKHQFIRIHRGFVINVAYINELVPWFAGGYELLMKDGSRIPVARRKVSELRTVLGM